MEFRIQNTESSNIHHYPTDDVTIAQKFAQELKNELGDFLQGVIIFGSSVRRQAKKGSDIDVLVVTDDLSYKINDPLIEGYKIIVENSIAKISRKLHVTSMTMTNFWDYSKAGDPVVVNILRDGVALIDTGFFNPLQKLLKSGRVRPSEESIWHYFGRAPKTLLNSRWHILQGTLDLYWAVIDSAHAALMRAKVIPPTPEHVAEILEKTFVSKNKLELKYVKTMKKFYDLSKKITHREIREIKGAEFDRLYVEADAFVKRMKKIIDKPFA